MKFFYKLNDITSKIEEAILSYSVIAMATILIGNVISRSVFNNSWKFAEEVGQFLLIFITFVGTSYAARKGKHINMNAIFEALPLKLKKVSMIIVSAFTGVTMFYLAYLSYLYMMKIHKMGRVTPALQFPMYLIIAVVVLGFLLSGIQYIINLILNLTEKEVYLGSEKLVREQSILEDLPCTLETKCSGSSNDASFNEV